MIFMSSNGIGYKDSSDTKNEVYERIYADLACYLLSDGGVGPREIVLFPANSDPQTQFFLYMLFEPFGGQIFFETKSPELTTFYGQRVASTIWDAFPDINRMKINRSEIYHQNNPPISNYEPSLLGTNGQPLQFKYLYNNSLIRPILAGPGIAIDYVCSRV